MGIMLAMTKDIHNIQGEILKRLLLSETARFSELKPEKVSSDQFTFHIKRLVEEGIILKKEDGLYELTIPGKDYANRFDIDSGHVKHEKQAKLGVLIIGIRQTPQGKEYLMQERLKQPFFGFRGFVTGKIKIGESVVEAATREFEEETGLSGDVDHKSVYHERIYNEEGELLEDKYFFICTVTNPTGELIANLEEGKNQWFPEAQVLEGNIFYDISDLLALTEPGAPIFSEKEYVVKKY